MLTTATFVIALAAAAIDLPLTGDPVSGPVLSDLAKVPGVGRIEPKGAILRLDVSPGAEVRLRDLTEALKRNTSRTTIDQDKLAITSQTIFELNAGQCFFCAEKPLGDTLTRKPFVRQWSVVDYVAKGRLRFRVNTSAAADLGTLGSDGIEDVVFTDRYEGVNGVDLYWPTGGVAWRPTETAARQEATASRKPLMIFPTAGT
jgi:hypothetical protein